MSTRSDLLFSAESLLRTRGYAAFSYADLAKNIGITKASIHHHFPTKENLGIAIVESYIFRFSNTLEDLNKELPLASERLTAFAQFFQQSSSCGMLPLCGALAADLSALPNSLQELTKKFFEIHLAWLETNIELGQAQGELKPLLDVKQTARAFLHTLEGGAFVSWALRDNAGPCFGLKTLMDGILVNP